MMKGSSEPTQTKEPRFPGLSAGKERNGTPNPGAWWLGGGGAVVDEAGRIAQVDESLAAWLGRPPAELVGLGLPQALGDLHPEWTTPLKGLLQRGAPFDQLVLEAQNGAGTLRVRVESCCHQGLRFIRLESELPLLRDLDHPWNGDSRGNEALEKMVHRLRRAEAQMENLYNRWPGIIFSQRPDFTFTSVSPKIEEWTGVPISEWRRGCRYFWQVVHEADTETLMKCLQDPALTAGGLTSSYRIRHVSTGRVIYLWEHRQTVRSPNGLLLGYEGIWLDITRQTIAERRLLTMSWKENLGTLTMGLAHDFCNIMTGIVSLSDNFVNELGDNENLRSGICMIRETAGQASELAHRIRQLHHDTPGERNYHDLNTVAASMTDVLQKVLPRRIKLSTALDPAQLPVYLDAVELQQVIVNLALNAMDAMPSGGSLIFATSRHSEAPSVHVLQGSLPRAPLVCLSIKDTGAGIAPALLTSIFDPFFTTKPLGKGSGLGLYNARLFVESHGAAISVETRERAGTTFHLWFAQTDFSESVKEEETAPLQRQTLLVAGGDPDSRNRVVELLRMNSFYVVPAENEQQGIDALRSPDYQFSGVVLLCRAFHEEEMALLRSIRAEKLQVKTFLSPLGCNADEFDTAILEHVDGTLPQELPAPEFVLRLKTLLKRT